MKKVDKEKEAYRLWWEYLKRSEDYREFCGWFQERRKNPDLPMPQKFKNDKRTSSPKESFNFLAFGDVFTGSFEEFWVEHKKKLKYILENKTPQPVEHYYNYIESDFDYCIDKFKEIEGREPTLQEFKSEFIRKMKENGLLGRHFYLMVEMSDEPDVLTKQFQKIIKNKKDFPILRIEHLYYKRHKKPSTNYLKIEELARYLKVFDLRKQGLKPKNIIEIINPEDDSGDQEVQRARRMDYEKAKRIIKNVEFGLFPGDYEKRYKSKTLNAKEPIAIANKILYFENSTGK